ncbi:hypothetical protein LCGC14_0932300 [marine sediment metagenome]|uniref:DOD-type homing endonuclease domain-containing protein n=1 Tax=marine sediment metagenome TaxID=412755 RepID=A0A0F9NSA0_9ZZZZ
MAQARRKPTRASVPIVRGPSESPDCSECPLAVGGKPKKPVAGEGPADPKFIIVGEGPGRQEVMHSRPFVGRSGQLLVKVLTQLGVEREDVYLANATSCFPGNKSGLEAARQCCRPRLDEELATMPGKPILTLGAVAAQSILGDTKFKITELSGSLHDIDVDGTGERAVICAIHPAAILRGGAGSAKKARAGELGIWNFSYDVAKLAALADGKSIRFSEDFEVELGSADRLVTLLEEFYEDSLRLGFIAIDVETDPDCPEPISLNAELTSMGVANIEWAISSSHELWSDDRCWDLFAQLCADPDIDLVYHNRQFDEQVLGRYEIEFDGARHDTMLLHHSAFPGADHRLQRVATQFFAVRPWKSNYKHGDGTMVEECEYNAMDVLLTARLFPVLKNCLDKCDGWNTYDVDNALVPIAMRMTDVGVPFNRERNAELRTQFLDVVDRTRNLIEDKAQEPEIHAKFIDHLAYQQARKRRKTDPPGFLERHAVRTHELTNGVRGKKGFILKGKEPVEFSISNNDHIVSYVQALGHRLSKQTATGKYSGDKEVLEGLMHIEDVRTIAEYKEAAYLYSHFVKLSVDGGKGLILDDEDRVHIAWAIHKITGRWGSSPNFQNWSLENLTGRPNLRTQVVTCAGWTLVGADWAQLEARIIAMMSGDEFLCEIFLGSLTCNACDEAPPGKFCPAHDVHTVFALEVWPDFLDREEKVRKVLRGLVKSAEYGGFYGGSIDTLFQTIVKEHPDTTMPQVARIVHLIAQKMPKVAEWHQQLMRDAIQKKEVRSAILGRRRCFPLGNADVTVVKNHPVQCLRGDQRVLTVDGWRPIVELVPGVDTLQQPSGNTTSAFKLRATGKRQTFELRTQGRGIFCTIEHRFLTYIRGGKLTWMKTRYLRAGSYVVIAHIPVSGGVDPAGVSPEIAEVLGAMFGDGHYAGCGFTITCAEHSYARRLSKFLRYRWPDLPCHVRKINKTEKHHKQLWSVSAESALANARLARLGVKKATARNKILPAWSETATFATRCALLRGLFDSDGGFGGVELIFTSTSRQLARSVQRLLWSVGADSRLYRLKGAVYRVNVRPTSVDCFRHHVGFSYKEKRDRLNKRKHKNPIDRLPPDLVKHLAEQVWIRLVALRKPWTDPNWSMLDRSRLTRARKGHASRQQLRKIFNAARPYIDVNDLERVLVFEFERVISVRKSRRMQTFDLEIFGDDHWYVAEGLVTHNSTAGDIMNLGFLQFMKEIGARPDLAETEPLIQGHDSLTVECWLEHGNEVAPIMTKAMTQTHTVNGIKMHYPAEAVVDPCWANV